MATSSFKKHFKLGEDRQTDFVRDMASKTSSTLSGNFESKFVTGKELTELLINVKR